MSIVSYREVKDIFENVWTDSAEEFFQEIAWECLTDAGLTSFEDEKTHALIYVYAFIIQMLENEFSYMAFDEYYAYSVETPADEPLTDAAIGWLYRDVLSNSNCEQISECFCTEADSMLVLLMLELRYTVADTLFHRLGRDLVLKLLFFSVSGEPLLEDVDEEDSDTYSFTTKKAFFDYCKTADFSVYDEFDDYHAMRIMHWIECHTCALDD